MAPSWVYFLGTRREERSPPSRPRTLGILGTQGRFAGRTALTIASIGRRCKYPRPAASAKRDWESGDAPRNCESPNSAVGPPRASLCLSAVFQSSVAVVSLGHTLTLILGLTSLHGRLTPHATPHASGQPHCLPFERTTLLFHIFTFHHPRDHLARVWKMNLPLAQDGCW